MKPAVKDDLVGTSVVLIVAFASALTDTTPPTDLTEPARPEPAARPNSLVTWQPADPAPPEMPIDQSLEDVSGISPATPPLMVPDTGHARVTSPARVSFVFVRRRLPPRLALLLIAMFADPPTS